MAMEILNIFKPNIKKLKTQKDVKGLIAVLQSHRDDRIRGQAARELGAIGDIRALDPLRNALRDKNRFVRESAVEAMGGIGNPDTIEDLIVALMDKDWGVHVSAMQSLKKIGGIRAILLLVQLLTYGKDDHFRLLAADVLSEIGDHRAVEPLIEALRSNNPEVRCLAAWVLGKIEGVRAIRDLITATKDEDKEVRVRAAWALQRITGEDFGHDAAKWETWWLNLS
jgi:HEAT repeat protein